MIERFKVDVNKAISRARRLRAKHLSGIEVGVSLPFGVTINVTPSDVERKVAREIVIRCQDRRVLNARECCDSCIDQALSSLQDVRSKLVEKQVVLSELQDSSLYMLIEMMLDPIRQFLTFEQRLQSIRIKVSQAEGRDPLVREAYLQALDVLRIHLKRTISEIARIGGISFPEKPTLDAEQWKIENYLPPKILLEPPVEPRTSM